MPYDQAKRLQALMEYLETLGISDVKELSYGSGKPHDVEQGLAINSVMSHFWAYKDSEPFEEFLPPSQLPSHSIMATTNIDIFSPSAKHPALADHFVAYNEQHSALKRISNRLFCSTFPGLGTELIDAHTIYLYTEYNAALVACEDIPALVPAYYPNFAQLMNNHDDSGFGWAYIDDASGTIVWDEKFSPADSGSFYVLPHQINDRLLSNDEVAVSQLYYENSERLHKQEQMRELKYYKLRQEKKNKPSDIPDLHTKEAKATFAKKCKALEDAAAAAAAKKQKGAALMEE
ncbi:hypothetical protein B0H13DRAFT_2390951 [Mycena leptocephala]|nr:hypothetical protein B0H13DRAFT_2390951 [Mycena leptocephala]